MYINSGMAQNEGENIAENPRKREEETIENRGDDVIILENTTIQISMSQKSTLSEYYVLCKTTNILFGRYFKLN